MERSASTENSYWDIKDLSDYLRVKIKTLYAMVPEIPHYRVGKLIRFRKKEIDSWMEQNRSAAFIGNNGKSAEIKGRLSGNCRTDIDKLIRKAIDQSSDETYNHVHGKSDRIEGPKRR